MARELATAKRLETAANYSEAEKHYAAVLSDMPESRAARIGMAHALFADSVAENDSDGFVLLANLQLDKYEWARLQPIMPQAYRDQFVEEKH